MGILTGKGIFCTVFALFVLCICWRAMNEGIIPDNKLVLIIIFALWELYVNAFYTAELKHKNRIKERFNSVKANVKNATSQSAYNKNNYYSIRRSETARNIDEKMDYAPNFNNYHDTNQSENMFNPNAYNTGKVLGAIGVLAATNKIIDDLNKKSSDSMRKTAEISRLHLQETSLMMQYNGGSISKEEYDRRCYDIDKKIEEIRNG